MINTVQKKEKLSIELSEHDWMQLLRYLLAMNRYEQIRWQDYQEIAPALMRLCAAIEDVCGKEPD